MHIVVDAMGSDNRPTPDVAGAVAAANEQSEDTLILAGPEETIAPELQKHRVTHDNVEIAHASDVITMDDKPSVVGKDKANSSMHVGMSLVKDGEADAFVTAGNTGAAQAIAMLFTLKRITGVKRPALSIIFPINGKPVIVLDVGANADTRPEWLVQFGVMGSIYAQNALGLPTPRVALLSNGEEDTKGSQLVQQAHGIMQDAGFNFVGNIEPPDVYKNMADVVVTDGFTGNILIKTFESTTRYLVDIIRHELKASVLSSIGALLARPAFGRVRKNLDPSEVGGAPLLGVNGVVIVAHGGSDARAIQSAVRQARLAIEGKVIDSITRNIGALELT